MSKQAKWFLGEFAIWLKKESFLSLCERKPSKDGTTNGREFFFGKCVIFVEHVGEWTP